MNSPCALIPIVNIRFTLITQDPKAQVRRIFLEGHSVLVVRTVIFKCLCLSSRMLTLFDVIILTKDIEGFKTYEDYKDDWIYEWNKDVPWVHEKSWTDDGAWKEPAPVEHYCEPFNYKNGCSEWPTYSWRDDGYCNGGNLPGAYIVGNALRY
ncbi:hypothetical protein Tco_0882004 [Tanacetum coccineum]